MSETKLIELPKSVSEELERMHAIIQEARSIEPDENRRQALVKWASDMIERVHSCYFTGSVISEPRIDESFSPNDIAEKFRKLNSVYPIIGKDFDIPGSSAKMNSKAREG